MAEAVLVPQAGQDLTEAKVVAIHVKLGDKVAKGDIVAEVESEKASFEVEAFASGTVLHLAYAPGDTATVLAPLMFLGEPGEKLDGVAAADTPAPEKTAADAPVAIAPAARANGKLRSSPLARRIAASGGVDIERLSGTGPHGAVVLRDVRQALEGGAQAASGESRLAFRNLRSGTGDPVVFLHGFGADLSAWRSFIDHVKAANPQIALDLPGHGGSAGEAASDFAALVDEVATALAAAGHTRLHLVGHSLGGAIAAALTARPDLDVRSLTLISPAGLGPKINGDFIEGFLSAPSEVALRAWMTSLVHDPARLPGALIRATQAARDGTGLASQQRRIAQAVFAGSTQLFSIAEMLKAYPGPCRVIAGRADSIIPVEHTENLPGHVALNRLSGVGHLPFLEAPELVGRLVAETIRAAP
ncbi:MAG: acetoin dehydrogenase dihydrolipoyllysine-residue acetyltransferase subunit [Parvibaculaceae bacterium]